MKRGAVSVAAVALMASGCSNSPGHAPPSSPAAPSTSAYLRVISRLYPTSATDADLLQLGHTICKAFAAGGVGTFSALLDKLSRPAGPLKPIDASSEILDTVEYLCPQYTAKIGQ